MTTKHARVLLVEDHAALRSAMLGALELAGFDATGAGDAPEALEVLGQRRIDVVVADYYLPGITRHIPCVSSASSSGSFSARSLSSCSEASTEARGSSRVTVCRKTGHGFQQGAE
jgi:DNA-binding NarL/FixJ family response regulator